MLPFDRCGCYRRRPIKTGGAFTFGNQDTFGDPLGEPPLYGAPGRIGVPVQQVLTISFCVRVQKAVDGNVARFAGRDGTIWRSLQFQVA